MCDTICSFVAGVIGRALFFPLDTIKVVSSVSECPKLTGNNNSTATSASSNHKHYSYRQAVKSVIQSDGIPGLYRGLGIALAASGPGVALYITSYEQAKKLLSSLSSNNNINNNSNDPAQKSKASAAAEHLLCGLAAEAVSCVVWVPMDVVKERLQSQHRGVAGRYRSSWHGLSTLYRLEGLRGMYKGYFSTLGSFGPFSAIYFAAFEEAQLVVRSGIVDRYDADRKVFGPGLEKATAAALANIFACIVTNPLEVSKTRFQVQRAVLEVEEDVASNQQSQRKVVGLSKQFKVSSTSMLDALRWSLKNEGLLSLWGRGLAARILYQTPSTAVTFGLYDVFKNKLCSTNK